MRYQTILFVHIYCTHIPLIGHSGIRDDVTETLLVNHPLLIFTRCSNAIRIYGPWIGWPDVGVYTNGMTPHYEDEVIEQLREIELVRVNHH